MTSKLLLYFFVLHSATLYAQPTLDSIFGEIDHDKLSSSIEKRLSRLEMKIISRSAKALERLQKQEEKINGRQTRTKDSLEARLKLVEVQSKYSVLAEKLTNPSSMMASNISQYIPHLDTIGSVLKFLDQNNTNANLKETFSRIESFNEKLQVAHEVNDFMCERREILQHELERVNLVKKLKRFNKKIYYYHEQIKDYKTLLSHPRKVERKVIVLLAKTKAFRDFMRHNSMLSSLFRMPRDPDDPVSLASLAGLQTRVDVNNLIAEQFASDAPNAQVRFQQNIQEAQAQMQQLKNKVMQFSRGNSDDIIPGGFRPNDEKPKSFFKKLEYGANIQAQRATNFFPATTDLGLSVGYKLNNKSIIGVGASYKAGLGRGWNHLDLSSQGAGLRSFVDWRLKGSIWITGGYEMNYKSQLRGVQISYPFGRGQETAAWQQSGLIGLSKLIDVKSKFFKKTKLQLLWDFLSSQQLPRTHPVIFRIGYNLK